MAEIDSTMATIDNGSTRDITQNITVDDRNKLLAYPSAKRWLERKRERSKMSYDAAGRWLIVLRRATRQDPETFLKWAKSHEPIEIQDKIDDIAGQFPESVAYNFNSYVRGFLKNRGIVMPRRDNTKYTNKEEHRAYTKDEILQLLSYLQDKRHKLYVLVIAESGLRHKDVVQLRIKHLQEDLDQKVIPTAIRLEPRFYQGKKHAGRTFLGEQSIKLLKECQADGKIGKNPEDRVIPLEYSGLNETLRRAKKNANLDPRIQPTHGLRKYFENALDKSEIDQDIEKRIEGHSNGARDAYTTKDWDELREEYRKAYPRINIQDPTGTKLAKSIESQQVEIDQLKSDLRVLTDKYNEIAAAGYKQLVTPKVEAEVLKQPTEKDQLERFLQLIQKQIPNLPTEWVRRIYTNLTPELRHRIEHAGLSGLTPADWVQLMQLQERSK